MSWRRRLISISVLCLIVPSVLTMVISGKYTREELNRQTIEKTQQSQEVADLYVSNMIRDMINALNAVHFDSEMTSLLRDAYKNNGKENESFFDYKQITEKLKLIPFFGGETYVTVLLPGGLYYTNYSTFHNRIGDLYDAPWLKKMAGMPINSTAWEGLQPNYVKSEASAYPHVITVVRAYKLFANTDNAYILVSKPEEQFHEVFARSKSQQEMMLLDAKGTVLSHQDPTRLGETVPYANESLKQGEVIEVGHRKMIYVEHDVANSDWKLVSLVPYDLNVGRISNLFNYSFVLQLIFFALFALILYYFLRQLTKPVIELVTLANRVQKGNLQVRSKLPLTNEMGLLGLAINRMLDRIQEMIQQVKDEQAMKRMAELKLLQAQLNPHFLFNTLNAIRLHALMKEQPEIGDLIGSLSHLLRMTINRDNEFAPLHEEIETMNAYMKLMNFRHQGQIRVVVDLKSNTLLRSFPRFFIQPIIENAFIHGFKDKDKEGTIRISSWQEEQALYLVIEDDGIGMTPDKREALQAQVTQPADSRPGGTARQDAKLSGIGLRNVYERLRIIYGSDFRMTIESLPGQGTRVILSFPSDGEREPQ